MVLVHQYTVHVGEPAFDFVASCHQALLFVEAFSLAAPGFTAVTEEAVR
jgi:hypothetical protein